ncbi:2OG-Fe(II) oxygenase family protein [Roseateles sp.]|uniref:2OG-Fe(II) oxygenase family protein n=1 Tax=Roseateles sp. TaxID=1971397 RepID=UPI00286A90EE|nr:2OG-Fe(II) oxygenase family protein [Roseateles sp.]
MIDYKKSNNAIIGTGFATIQMSPELLANFTYLTGTFRTIAESTRTDFSFSGDTDGFLPFGSEFSIENRQPDLCERFFYWPSNLSKRLHHPFVQSSFMQAVQAYEAEISQMAEAIMREICVAFDAQPLNMMRSASYLQLCAYSAKEQSTKRRFAQNPHEDGHLLSFIKPTHDGLVLVKGQAIEPVRLLKNELAVLSGSLLTELSDQAIPASYHAVLMPHHSVERSSLIYFTNPNVNQNLFGFYRKAPLSILKFINERHTEFGNRILELANIETSA